MSVHATLKNWNVFKLSYYESRFMIYDDLIETVTASHILEIKYIINVHPWAMGWEYFRMFYGQL